ncbi:transposase [Citreimonas salinaria]|uniref:Transposase DDE domain-containing protein n=1 Tax=Citreimonas salinaria TaxID=321339 RepID=A0A1H3L831_9RHOB|nr:Transposase DDE domain-containing protein [Citreimonas salinaria]
MALRQTTGFVESLLRLVGLDWAVPDFSTSSRRRKTLAVTIPYRGSQGPLNRLIDSSGIKAEGEGEWHARKHGGAKRRLWRKIHTGSNVDDTPMLPELLDQIPADVEIGSVTADGAYDTRRCHDAVANRGADAATQERQALETLDGWCDRPERGVARIGIPRPRDLPKVERLPPPKPRRDETKMHCVKLLGQSLMARDFDRQVAELHVCAAVLNGCTVLGIPVTEPMG